MHKLNIIFVFFMLVVSYLPVFSQFHTELLTKEVEEASGLCFDSLSNQLICVGDEGSLYLLSLDGEIVREKFIHDKADFEGVCLQGGLLYILEESGTILQYSIIEEKIVGIKPILPMSKGKVILPYNLKSGFEGITARGDTIYVVRQGEYPCRGENCQHKKCGALIGLIEGEDAFSVGSITYFSQFVDLSGLHVVDQGMLILIDEGNLLYLYRADGSELTKLPLKGGLEGVAIVDQWLYIAIDKGGGIYRIILKGIFD